MRMRDALESGSAFRAGEPRPGGPGDSLITEVAINKKEVAVCLTPPLASLGFLSTELAPRGIKPRAVHGFIIQLIFNLDAGYRSDYDAHAMQSLVWSKKMDPNEYRLANLCRIRYSYK